MANKQAAPSTSANQRFAERFEADRLRKEQEKIVSFFLDLYNFQLQGSQNTPKFFRLTSHKPGVGTTYELKVKHLDKWNSRPMGINPIGEEGGTKSSCFKVIYDEVLVVKIPRRPIADLQEYIQGILKERRIANQLQPEIQCIVPGVSPVLKKIHSFHDGMHWTPEEFEDKSLMRLKHLPQFQKHLKIGKSFAFFMDISKHSFLLQVLDKIRESSQKVKNEIIKQPELISKFHKFEERYGIEKAPAWLSMRAIYEEYLEKTDAIIAQRNLSRAVHGFKRRKWFLTHLAQEKLVFNEPHIPHGFFKDLNRILSSLSSRYASDFENYRKTVENFVKNKSFGQSRFQISGILTSILRLLAVLREKKTAIRDLKPDNIFVAGQSSQIALALAQRKNVFLGLIDFETAASIDNRKVKRIEQPLLGGTPSFATPANFITNELIERLFGDIPRALHLQDWHACMCMIFSAVTGEMLFKDSKNYLSQIIHSMRKEIADRKELALILEENSFQYWVSAQNEFKKRTVSHKNRLKEITVAIPSKVTIMFLEEAVRSKKYFQSKIKQTLEKQKHVKNPKGVGFFLKSTPEKIARLRDQWQDGLHSRRTPTEVRESIVHMLIELESWKKQEMRQAQWIETFKERSLKMEAYEILYFMFGIVTQTLQIKPSRESSFKSNNLSPQQGKENGKKTI